MQAEAHRGRLRHALARIAGLIITALGAAFMMTLLLAGQGSADAASTATGAERPSAASITDVASGAGDATSAIDGDAADDSSTSSRPALWADADALSTASARRAAESSSAAVWSSLPSVPSLAERVGGDRGPDAAAPVVGVGLTSSPIGSFGASGGAPDAGPSITQLAVLAAALLGVLWLSQRLLASELSWRSAFLTLSIERPG